MKTVASVQSLLAFLEEKKIPYSFQGDDNARIYGFSSLKNYKKDTFTWAKNEKAYQYGFADKKLVIAQDGLQVDCPNVIISKESKRAFFALIEYWADTHDLDNKDSIGPGTILGTGVRLGKNVRIGSNCVIQGNIEIGDNTRIWHNVTILNHVMIGSDCEIQSGCVIGHDGFAWNENQNHRKEMIRHFGSVEIGNEVYLGPNCVIDRGEIDATIIGEGCRLDAACFIAHNVVLGKNVILITGSRLYGSSELGDNAYVASGLVRNQCRIGAGTFVGMGSVVTDDLPENVTAVGVPAKIIKRGV